MIFTSDNGPAGRPAPPFSGNKTTNLEGGVREPCLMRWPGRIPAGTTCDRIAGNIDVLPTLAKVIGAQVPTDRILDGRDLSPLLADPSAPPCATRTCMSPPARSSRRSAKGSGNSS